MDDLNNSSQCIHCGECTINCEFLNAYGLELSDTKQLEELAYHCFLCGQCRRKCPQQIDGPQQMLQMRRKKVAKNEGKLKEPGYGLIVTEKQHYLFNNYKQASAKSVLFTGCNFPSLYPQTTQKLAALLKNKTGIGIIYDCCGKPISELGLIEKEETIITRINQRLSENGVEELVMVCPNCYYYLKPRLNVGVVTIYEKLLELGLGQPIDEPAVHLFAPCPDKNTLFLKQQIASFLPERVEVISDVQCCGLGGCAGVREPELAKIFPQKLQAKKHDHVYTYCASCAGNLARAGLENIHHILVEILETNEQPELRRSLLNRAKTKFY